MLKFACAPLLIAALPCVALAQSSAVARPRITAIAYVRFYESDVAAAKNFFGEKLGLPEGSMGEGALYRVNPMQAIEIAPLPTPAPGNRLAEIAFVTSDVKAMRQYLEAHHVPVYPLPNGELKLADPQGFEIGFVSELPQVPVEEKPGKQQTSKRIIHAGIGVRDPKAEDKLFRDVLGFRPYWHGGKTEGETDWISLQVPDGTDWIEYMLRYDPAHDSQKALGGEFHVSLGVEKISEAGNKLAANGWTDASTREPKVGRDGKWQLNVFDPDGSRVEFMEFRPSQTPCCSQPTAQHPSSADKLQ